MGLTVLRLWRGTSSVVKCSMTIKTDPGIPARTQCKPGGFPSALKEPFLCNQLPLVSSIQNTFISRCAAQTVQVLSMILYMFCVHAMSIRAIASFSQLQSKINVFLESVSHQSHEHACWKAWAPAGCIEVVPDCQVHTFERSPAAWMKPLQAVRIKASQDK